MSTTVHVIGRHDGDVEIRHIVAGNRVEVEDKGARAWIYLSLSVAQLDRLIAVATEARNTLDRIYSQHAPEGEPK